MYPEGELPIARSDRARPGQRRRILTYKRTHVGDPDRRGRFGIYNCMGRMRELDFDAVIGVGGIGDEPRSFGIDGKINWVGINARKRRHPTGDGVEVTFEEFRLLEDRGPLLRELAPLLARRMYGKGARILLNGYSAEEQAEAESILEWALNQPHTPRKQSSSVSTNGSCKSRCRPSATQRVAVGGATSSIEPNEILLSRDVSVADYLRLEAAEDRDAIAAFVRKRFSERYLDPVDVEPERKNGFTIMAVSCLMIEALESFRRGWPKTKKKAKPFTGFFNHWPQFDEFAPVSQQFYKHIRCGILHQAETTGGWRVRRDGPLLDSAQKKINATKFVRALRKVLEAYCDKLATEPWDSQLWRCLRKKMKAVCSNAVGTQGATTAR